MKTSYITAIAMLFLLGVHARSAQAQTGSVSYPLKHRSSFTLQATQHNPFWPIGWEKGAAVKTQAQPEGLAAISAQNFTVTGISISSTPMAVINGQNCAEGETINAMFGGQKIKILVVAINDGSVVLQYLNKKYVIEMKRPELNSKAPPKEIPSQDKTMLLH